MVDVRNLRIIADALRDSITIALHGVSTSSFPYENWERTLPEELSLDRFFFAREDAFERGLYVAGRPGTVRPRRE